MHVAEIGVRMILLLVAEHSGKKTLGLFMMERTHKGNIEVISVFIRIR